MPNVTAEHGSGEALRPPRDDTVETIREFFRLGRGYWGGPHAGSAWLLTAGVLSLVLAGIFMQVGVNRWNGMFFDAMEQKDWTRLVLAIELILALALAMGVSGAAYVQVKMRLQVRWRSWLAEVLLSRWMSERRFYRLTIANGSGITNPEYRIADDVRNATEPLVDFVAALTTAVLTAATFIGILWYVAGSISFEIHGRTITIPGFMVLGVLAYSAVATTLMVHIGRPLIRQLEARNAAEAGFRYGLTRTRESAEQIALAGSDADERQCHSLALATLVSRWIVVIAREARMTALTNTTMTLTSVIPLLMCAPKYLQGNLTLGELVQVAAAFVQVHQSLNWLADNAIRVAEWLASAQRVVALSRSLERIDNSQGQETDQRIAFEDSADGSIRLERLRIAAPSGNVLIDGTELVFARGQNVLIRGASGTGKSTLVRAMAGLWPWGSGIIRRPAHSRSVYLLQRPLIPDGTLRQALLYPNAGPGTPDTRLREALRRCGLSQLCDRLDEEGHWNHELQGGEQQRLAFARLLIDPPDIVIMDEATSALDELSEARMMEILRIDLSETTSIFVGRRAGLETYFDRILLLAADAESGHIVLREAATSPERSASGH